jgi:hypothetical protein
MKIPDILMRELRGCPLPWRIEQGSLHYKIFIEDTFIGIFPLNSRKSSTAGRGGLNVRSNIRRYVREKLNGQRA